MDLNLCITAMLIMCSSLSGTCAIEVDVQLVDGPTPSQGRVVVRDPIDQRSDWKPLCAGPFGEREASVVCRQLGYRHSRNEPNVYMPKIPKWIVDSTSCYGNESNIGHCFRGRHTCFHTTDSYASVCCSSSSEFGDWINDTFISHCADSWLGAQRSCEKLDSSITVHKKDQPLIPGFKTDGDVWDGQFVTPWIWSNGCVRFTSEASGAYREDVIARNSPGICFQHCGHAPETLFVLSGTVCRCVSDVTAIEKVVPGNCTLRCPGNQDQYCGDGIQNYWDLYRIGSRDTEFAVYSAMPNETRQCAGFKQKQWGKHKLLSQPCNVQAGHICNEFNKFRSGYIPLVSPKMTQTLARQNCRNITKNWKLAGNDILDAKLFSMVPEGFWVDIEATLVPVHAIKDFNVTNNIDPERCQSVTVVNNTASSPRFQIVDCRETRLLYTCSPLEIEEATRPTRLPIETTQPSNTTVVVTNEETVPGQRLEILEISIAVIVALVLALALVALFICWTKRKRRLRYTQRHETVPANEQPVVTVSYYSGFVSSSRTTGDFDLIGGHTDTDSMQDPAKDPLNVYEEIPDRSSRIYFEIQEDISSSNEDITLENDGIDKGNSQMTSNDTVADETVLRVGSKLDSYECNVGEKTNTSENCAMIKKESVKLKTSYAMPMDTVREKPGVKRHDSNAADQKYSYPYDSVKRFDKESVTKVTFAEENLQDSLQKNEYLTCTY